MNCRNCGRCRCREQVRAASDEGNAAEDAAAPHLGDAGHIPRRNFLVRSGRAAMVLLSGTVPLIAGCGGSGPPASGTTGNDGVDPDFGRPDEVPYVARLTSGDVRHYDTGTHLPLPGCPACAYDGPLGDGTRLRWAMQFEWNDASAFPGSQLSSFTVDDGIAPAYPPASPPSDRAPVRYEDYPIQQWFGFVYVKAGLVHDHDLYPCVERDQPVTHVHLIVKSSPFVSDYKAYCKLHVGYYQDGGQRCFVVYDSLHKQNCYKSCFPPDDPGGLAYLKDILRAVLKDALLAALGVTVVDWLIDGVAAVLASALLPVLEGLLVVLAV